ncbi:MAG: alanine--glyoxylate aminotransferase family protein [Actinomycetota bacterium]|nr:alanine--glyoxylate aminotransferase family protein [Actinomycetota bacterium]
MAQKRYLFTPGPTPVPPQVLAALSEPVLHHRAPDFREVYARVLGRLQEVHRTENDVLLFTCSGTGAFESAIVNLCSPGERVLAVSAGSFGERWSSMARTFGCEVEELRYAWGETPSADDLRRKLQEIEPVSLVFLVHSETSTGVVADIQALAAVAKDAGALVVVDGVSSLGAVPLEMDAWGLDVVVSGSQKALMTPPGLATAAVSAAAWEQVGRATLPSFYFDWEKTRKAQAALDSAFTPAVSLIVALDVALGLLLEQGLEAAFEHHVRLGRACRAGIQAMGLELFSPDEDRAAVVTAARMPDGLESSQLTLELRERHGVTIAGGQGELKNAIFRIGHIGWYDEFDIATALNAVELVLGGLGAAIERGVAATRALEVYAEGAAV